MPIGTSIYLLEHHLGIFTPKREALALFGVNLGLAVLVFGLLDSGVFIRGSGRQQATLEARAERATVTS